MEDSSARYIRVSSKQQDSVKLVNPLMRLIELRDSFCRKAEAIGTLSTFKKIFVGGIFLIRTANRLWWVGLVD